MANKKGRKSAFDTIIKPNLENIKQWTKDGLTDAEIIKKLGINKSTYYRYKSDNKELKDCVKDGRSEAVEKLEKTMFQSAMGGKETVKKSMKVKKIKYKDGKKELEYETMEPYEEEIYTPPNVTAAIFLLKHWAKDKGYTNDPQTLELKREEFEHQKEMDKVKNW